jgi:hypothetical protein
MSLGKEKMKKNIACICSVDVADAIHLPFIRIHDLAQRKLCLPRRYHQPSAPMK